ncbi:MAG TPA: ATP-binding cassette domain-containing protein [Acidimicrobiales bacterium]|nr:ATP-binding cassette domain-containing protein [Acidimicrobiales bacterium]
MEQLLSLTLSGLVTGAIYSLVAGGLVLTYSTARVFNFAFGAIAFSTAFLYYELNTGLGWPAPAAFLLAAGVQAPLLGFICDRVIFRRLRGADEAANVMAAVGLSGALPALTLMVVDTGITSFGWGVPNGENILVPPGIGPVPAHSYALFDGVSLDSNQLIVFASAAAAALFLWVLVSGTRAGLAMRATVDRPDLAEYRGISTGRSSAIAWVTSCMMAGIAGVVGAPVLGHLTPEVFTGVLLVAATAAVLGGLRSVPLAFAGGLALGVAQNLAAGYGDGIAATLPGFGSSISSVLMLVGLFVLSLRRTRAAGTAAPMRASVDHSSDLSPWRRRLPWVLAAVAFESYALFLADELWRGILARAIVMGVVFLSITVATGYGRLVSLAQATLVTGAALMMGLLVDRGVPVVLAAVGGVLLATALGLVVAVPSLRMGGLAFALGTLALALLGDGVLFAWESFSNGFSGWSIPAPVFLGFIDMADSRTFIVVASVILAIVLLLLRSIQQSSAGRRITAVAAIESAASASGVSPARVKLGLFAFSAAIAGLGGVLLGLLNGSVNNATYPAEVGFVWLATVVLMGVRRSGGAVVAAAMFVISGQFLASGFHWPDWVPTALSWNGTSSPYIPQILFGLGAVQLAQNPYGILSLTAEKNHRRRQRGAAARAAREGTSVDEPVRVLAKSDRASAPEARRNGEADRHPPGAGELALELRDVVAGYDSAEVLHGVDLAVPAGSIVGVLGPNGAGKSTLVAVLAGSVTPTAGTVHILGEDVTRTPAHQRVTRGLALVPESRGIFPGLTVEDNLSVWLASPEDRQAALDRFPVLAERRRLAAGDLSGGEQQMLALAPLLVRAPSVVVADEPTLGLAPRVAALVIDLLRDLREAGSTVVIVEEKPHHVLGLSEQVVFMATGRIRWIGSPGELGDAELAELYLGAKGHHA